MGGYYAETFQARRLSYPTLAHDDLLFLTTSIDDFFAMH